MGDVAVAKAVARDAGKVKAKGKVRVKVKVLQKERAKEKVRETEAPKVKERGKEKERERIAQRAKAKERGNRKAATAVTILQREKVEAKKAKANLLSTALMTVDMALMVVAQVAKRAARERHRVGADNPIALLDTVARAKARAAVGPMAILATVAARARAKAKVAILVGTRISACRC